MTKRTVTANYIHYWITKLFKVTLVIYNSLTNVSVPHVLCTSLLEINALSWEKESGMCEED